MFSIYRHDEPCLLPKEQENLFPSEEAAQACLDEILGATAAQLPEAYLPALQDGWEVRDVTPPPAEERFADDAHEEGLSEEHEDGPIEED